MNFGELNFRHSGLCLHSLFFSLLEAINKEMSILIYIEKIMFFGFWKFEQSTLQRIYHEFSAGKTLNLLRIMKQTFPSQTLVWNFSTLLRKQIPRRDPNPPMGSAKLPTSTLICSSFSWFQLQGKNAIKMQKLFHFLQVPEQHRSTLVAVSSVTFRPAKKLRIKFCLSSRHCETKKRSKSL